MAVRRIKGGEVSPNYKNVLSSFTRKKPRIRVRLNLRELKHFQPERHPLREISASVCISTSYV